MIERPQIEVNIVRHCNNRCANCSHASPFTTPFTMPPEMLKGDLDLIAPFIRAREFYVVGGEPLLHPKLEAILDVVNESPVGELTVIETNGHLLPKMSDVIWQKIDAIRLSIYANLDASIPDLAKAKCEQFGVRYDEMRVSQFWKQFHASLDGASFKDCPWKNVCLTVHDGWLFRCPQSAFFPPIINPRFTFGVDGYPLFREKLTEDGIRKFLESDVPLITCHFCRGYTDAMDWHEVSSREDWMRESTI